MTAPAAHPYVALRRLTVLRIVCTLGEANDSVVIAETRPRGFGQSSHADIRADLDFLRDHGALAEEWFDTFRIVKATERGEDCAHGRVSIDGVEHSPWRQP